MKNIQKDMKLKLYVLLIIIFLSTGDIGTTYRSLIDGYHGFKKVVITGGDSIPYENNTININVGDEIIWINDDSSDILTIINDQMLWGNDTAILIYYGRQFSYTFNESGTYTFYIKQYRAFPKQIVIVSGISTNNNTIANINGTNTTINTTIEPTISPTMTASPTIDTTIDITVSPTVTNIVNINDTIGIPYNKSNVQTENIILTNPILMPLDILKNIKITGMIVFIIITTLSFLRKNGERK